MSDLDDDGLDARERAAFAFVARGPGAVPRPPSELGGYRVGRLLGRGGMGAVYAAEDPTLARTIALKVTPAQGAHRHALDEARLLAALKHPNLAQVFAAGTDQGFHWVAMELVPGAPLSAQRLARVEAEGVARALLEGVAAAHAAGVVHRDLKPSNVMVTPEHGVKVLDFGLARTGGQPGDRSGTQGFMAPEQAAGAPVDTRADVWALGRLLETLGLGETRRWRGLIRAALQVEPSRRPKDAGAMLAWLERRAARGRAAAGIGVLVLAAVVLFGWLSRAQAPAVTVSERTRLAHATEVPLRAALAEPGGARAVLVTSHALEWVETDGSRHTTPWPDGDLVDAVWDPLRPGIWVLSAVQRVGTVHRIAFGGGEVVTIGSGPWLRLKVAHDGAFALTLNDDTLFRLGLDGRSQVLLRGLSVQDFDVSPDGTQVGLVSFDVDDAPVGELRVLELASGKLRSAGKSTFWLEGGRAAFAWPEPGRWLYAIAEGAPRQGTTVRASAAGTLEPFTVVGTAPLAAISAFHARGLTVSVLESRLQTDVLLAPLDGGAPRALTNTPSNERALSFVEGALEGMSDGFGGWTAVRFSLDGGDVVPLGPERTVTWPEPTLDGGRYAFRWKGSGSTATLALIRLPDTELRELGPANLAMMPPSPTRQRVRCHALGCLYARIEDGGVRVETPEPGGASTLLPVMPVDLIGLSVSPSGRWLTVAERPNGVVLVDLGDGGVERRSAGGCLVHATSVDDRGEVVLGQECYGSVQLVLRSREATSLLFETPHSVLNLVRVGDEVAFGLKRETGEAWRWQLEDSKR